MVEPQPFCEKYIDDKYFKFMEMYMNQAAKMLPESDLINFETYLNRAFRPVKPRPEFIEGLRDRLGNVPRLQETPAQAFRSLILILIGVMGSIVVVVASIRAALSLIEAYRVLRTKKY